LKKFAVEYNHNDERWALTIHAVSYDDALSRLQSISRGSIVGQFDGFTTGDIPAFAT